MDLNNIHCYILTIGGSDNAQLPHDVYTISQELKTKFPDHQVEALPPLPEMITVQGHWDGEKFTYPDYVHVGWKEIQIQMQHPEQAIQYESLRILTQPHGPEGACVLYGTKALDTKKVVNFDSVYGIFCLKETTLHEFMGYVPTFTCSALLSQSIFSLMDDLNSGENAKVQSAKAKLQNEKAKLQTEKAKVQSIMAELKSTKAELQSKKTELQSTKAEVQSITAKMKAELLSTKKLKSEKKILKNENASAKKELTLLNSQLASAIFATKKLKADLTQVHLELTQVSNATYVTDSAKDELKTLKMEFAKLQHKEKRTRLMLEQTNTKFKTKCKDFVDKSNELNIAKREAEQREKFITKQAEQIIELSTREKKRNQEDVKRSQEASGKIIDYAALRISMDDMCKRAGIECEGKTLKETLDDVIKMLDSTMQKINKYSDGNIDRKELDIMVRIFRANKFATYTFKDIHQLFAIQQNNFQKRIAQYQSLSVEWEKERTVYRQEHRNLKCQIVKHILSLRDTTPSLDKKSRVLCTDVVTVTEAIMSMEEEYGVTFWTSMVGKYSLDPRTHNVPKTVAFVANRVLCATMIQRQWRRFFYMKMYNQVFSVNTLDEITTARVEYTTMSLHTFRRKLNVIYAKENNVAAYREYHNKCIFSIIHSIAPRNMEYLMNQIKGLVELKLMKETPVSGPVVRMSNMQEMIETFCDTTRELIDFSQDEDPENIRLQIQMMFQDYMKDCKDEILVLSRKFPLTWVDRFILGVPIPNGGMEELRQFMFDTFTENKKEDPFFTQNLVKKIPKVLVQRWNLTKSSAIRLSVKWNTLHECVHSNLFDHDLLPSWFKKHYKKKVNRSGSP